MQYLNHITLETGHNRRSPRHEVDAEVVRFLMAHLSDAIKKGTSPIPTEENYALKAETRGADLTATVASAAGTPILSFAIVQDSNGAKEFWDRILRRCKAPASTLMMPSAPWLAVWIESPAMAFSISEWVADYERCIAWTWIKMSGASTRRE